MQRFPWEREFFFGPNLRIIDFFKVLGEGFKSIDLELFCVCFFHTEFFNFYIFLILASHYNFMLLIYLIIHIRLISDFH